MPTSDPTDLKPAEDKRANELIDRLQLIATDPNFSNDLRLQAKRELQVIKQEQIKQRQGTL